MPAHLGWAPRAPLTVGNRALLWAVLGTVGCLTAPWPPLTSSPPPRPQTGQPTMSPDLVRCPRLDPSGEPTGLSQSTRDLGAPPAPARPVGITGVSGFCRPLASRPPSVSPQAEPEFQVTCHLRLLLVCEGRPPSWPGPCDLLPPEKAPLDLESSTSPGGASTAERVIFLGDLVRSSGEVVSETPLRLLSQ